MIYLCKKDCPKRKVGCQANCPILEIQNNHNRCEKQNSQDKSKESVRENIAQGRFPHRFSEKQEKGESTLTEYNSSDKMLDENIGRNIPPIEIGSEYDPYGGKE